MGLASKVTNSVGYVVDAPDLLMFRKLDPLPPATAGGTDSVQAQFVIFMQSNGDELSYGSWLGK